MSVMRGRIRLRTITIIWIWDFGKTMPINAAEYKAVKSVD